MIGSEEHEEQQYTGQEEGDEEVLHPSVELAQSIEIASWVCDDDDDNDGLVELDLGGMMSASRLAAGLTKSEDSNSQLAVALTNSEDSNRRLAAGLGSSNQVASRTEEGVVSESVDNETNVDNKALYCEQECGTTNSPQVSLRDSCCKSNVTS